jgi:hypothetical protein
MTEGVTKSHHPSPICGEQFRVRLIKYFLDKKKLLDVPAALFVLGGGGFSRLACLLSLGGLFVLLFRLSLQ